MKKSISKFLAVVLTAALCFGEWAPAAYAAEAKGIHVVYDEESSAETSPDAGKTSGTETLSETETAAESESASNAENTSAAETTASAETSTFAETSTSAETSTAAETQTSAETSAATETPVSTENPAGTETPADTKKPAQTAARTSSVKGGIELVITAGIPVQADQRFTVKLTGPESRSAEAVLSYSESNAADQTRLYFDGLAAGTYRLSVSADGYMSFAQDIKVEQYTCKVQLYTGIAEGFDSAAHPGLLIAGDFDGDGRVSEADRDILVDAMSQEQYMEICDINRDGQVDMVDLQYFSKYFDETVAADATLEMQIPAGAIEPLLGTNTEMVSGTLEDVLKGEGSAVLTTADGNAIDPKNPLEVEFDFTGGGQINGFVIQAPEEAGNAITQATLTIEYEDADGTSAVTELSLKQEQAGTARLMANPAGGQVKSEEDGSITVNLSGKIAVKRVTIRITATATPGGSLAEISRVEFLNNMENRIPAPTMYFPTGLTADPGNKQIHLSWKKVVNVLAYEVSVTYNGTTETHRTTATSFTVSSFAKNKLKNGETYEIAVRSINGDWKSAYCPAITAVPKTDKKPDAPANVHVEGAYRALIVRFSAAEDTDTCNLYYKQDGADSFEKIEGLEGSQYRIDGLEDNTKYLLYVTGVNELGEGAASELTEGATISLQPVQFPQYRILTPMTGEGQLLEHVKNASKRRGEMIDSPLDAEGNSALGLVDGSFSSYLYIDDWNEAGDYGAASQGVVVELDQAYTMDRFTFGAPDNTYSYRSVRVFYLDADGNETEATGLSLLQRRDANNRIYYVIKLAEPITTSQVRFGFTRYVRGIAISELRFYEYDSLEADIQALYEDDLHLTLRADVTMDTINALYARLDEQHNGETHPDRELLQRELDEAKLLFETQSQLGGVVKIEAAISDKWDSHVSVGGLNSWQPIGISALAEEEIIIYVGHPDKKAGSTTDLYLVASQYYAPGSAVGSAVTALKVGRNVVSCRQLIDSAREKGGSLYIEYRGSNAEDNYAVRASGSAQIPVLNLYGVTDEAERDRRIDVYVQQLEAYVNALPALHESAHGHTGYEYQAQECVANTTEIMLDHMLLSLPATQVYAALGSNAAATMKESAIAMDGMMELFYQHKGLTDRFAADTAQEVIDYNHLPARHLNIRYMNVAGGAFMYAAGNHIGIRWGSTGAPVSGKTPVTDANGKKVSGQYFGWGLAHEIGHNINQGSYAVAEVTNNYFSVLAQAADTNNSVRFLYDNVYKKVTSGTTGRASNVFTQLGLYWQLHLAYDRGYNYRTYDSYEEIFNNLFFARVDSYARNAAAAPAPGGVKLTLEKDADQNLMRLASAAAERDLTEFFTRWGMVPNAATRKYMQQFDKEQRAIYYACDDARVYALENGGASGTDGTIEGQAVVSGVQAVPNEDTGEVVIKVSGTAAPGVILGYEIVRIITVQGRETRETVGFTTTGEFTDNISFLGNRGVSYEVTAVDQYLNYSASYRVEAFKAGGSGILEKENWTVATNMTSDADQTQEAGEGEGQLCEPVVVSGAGLLIDGDRGTVYTGSASGEDPWIVLQLNQIESICGLRYVRGAGSGIDSFRIEVSADGENYTTVKSGRFDFDSDNTALFYFTNQDVEGSEGKDPRIAIYDAAFVRITAAGQAGSSLSAAEIDLLAPSGDNIEFYTTGATEAIGILAEDYVYQASDGASIPAGSLIFTGTYKGNPAYNVVVLYDEQGNIVGGTDSEGALVAEQIILAPDPGNAMLGDVSEGSFIYWITPDQIGTLPAKVRAELYRVDDALTNEGQRLVSDTLFTEVKPLEQLPEIHLTGSAAEPQN